jgi:hypothetical protein
MAEDVPAEAEAEAEAKVEAEAAPVETLSTLIAKESATAAEIAAHLDALSEDARVAEVRACSGALQKKLWGLVEGCGIDTTTFVPEAESTVIYAGKNSLAMFTHFEKRFWRVPGGATIGYNQQSMKWFSGPGYFLVRDGDNGELLFDYTATPELQPTGWPSIRPNTGFYSIVYGGMIDTNRRVSRDTVIGSAARNGKSIDSFYLLTRVRPPQPEPAPTPTSE